jgi:hypothetical protein
MVLVVYLNQNTVRLENQPKGKRSTIGITTPQLIQAA